MKFRRKERYQKRRAALFAREEAGWDRSQPPPLDPGGAPCPALSRELCGATSEQEAVEPLGDVKVEAAAISEYLLVFRARAEICDTR